MTVPLAKTIGVGDASAAQKPSHRVDPVIVMVAKTCRTSVSETTTHPPPALMYLVYTWPRTAPSRRSSFCISFDASGLAAPPFEEAASGPAAAAAACEAAAPALASTAAAVEPALLGWACSSVNLLETSSKRSAYAPAFCMSSACVPISPMRATPSSDCSSMITRSQRGDRSTRLVTSSRVVCARWWTMQRSKT